MNQLLTGDCLDLLPTFPANHFDACIIDPPYALAFMQAKWDTFKSARKFQKWCRKWAAEVLRVLKPGAHLLAFGGARTYHRIACAIEDAGFEIRDQIMWVYGSGFCKAGYLKNQDKSQVREGWGGSMKPAHEPICVARKPLEKGLTVAANVLRYGTGALNIDGCRVVAEGASAGRWPANLIHDGSEEVAALFPQTTTNSRGTAPLGELLTRDSRQGNAYGAFVSRRYENGEADTGSAARFFYSAKASTAERGEGNDHPCVKPQKLLRYLARLVTPPGGLILDHFTGSGSGPLAFAAEGFGYVAMDLDQHNIDIATKRLEKASYSLALV